MISAGSAVSESRTAPRTDCSASRFCGGAIGPSYGLPPPLEKAWPLVRSGALMGRPSLGLSPVAAGWPDGSTLLVPRDCHRHGTKSARSVRNDDRRPGRGGGRCCEAVGRGYFCSV